LVERRDMIVPRMASGRVLMRSTSPLLSRALVRGLTLLDPPDLRLLATGVAAVSFFFFISGDQRLERSGSEPRARDSVGSALR
jgi:hypothetical protein